MFNNVTVSSDKSGCWFYRIATPQWTVQGASRKINFVETNRYCFDPKFYQGVTHVSLQRHIADIHRDVIRGFFKPLSKEMGFWLTLNLDDDVIPQHIPKWNHAHAAYNTPTNFEANLKEILEACDFTVVTTNELRDIYVKHYNLNPNNFVVIPNYLPRWWVGEAYDVGRQMTEYHKNKRRPRIGFTSSLSHFDLNNQNNGVDDFTPIVDFIKSTVDKYEWCFIGAVPQQLHALAVERKILCFPGSDIFNFMREVKDKNFQAIVAPLADIPFNHGKSNIKLIEAWALGVPIIAQDIITYNKYTNLVFKDADSLQNKLDHVLSDPKRYREIVEHHRNIVDYGEKPYFPNGAWLEKNTGMWMNLFTLPQKTLIADVTKVTEKRVFTADTGLVVEK